MSEQPEQQPVIVERYLERPHLQAMVDTNGMVHFYVANADEEGNVEVVEDFIIHPGVAEPAGLSLFRLGVEGRHIIIANQRGTAEDSGTSET